MRFINITDKLCLDIRRICLVSSQEGWQPLQPQFLLYNYNFKESGEVCGFTEKVWEGLVPSIGNK